MGIQSVFKIGGEMLTQSRKTYIKPMCQLRTLESLGLKMEQLTGDVLQISKKVKPPETYMEMIQHFLVKHPRNKELVKNIAIKGVDAHPTDIGLICMKNFLSKDSSAYIRDLSRSISLKPNAQSYLLRYEQFIENGNTKEAMNDLRKALEYAKKENWEPESIAELESLLGSSSSNVARKLKPLPLTKEQVAFDTKIDEYWNKYQKEINEAFEEKMHFSLSNANCTQVETSAKNHLLNSIKQIGKAEDFGIVADQKLYHGTNYSACNSINSYGFDLNKCSRMESGKGAYFGFDEQAIRGKYGSSIVVAKFTGKNIAKIEPGVYSVINEGGACTPFKLCLADKLGLDICKDEKLIDEIISRYYNNMLENNGIEGLIVDASFNAGVPYFMVPNPTKYIEIL